MISKKWFTGLRFFNIPATQMDIDIVCGVNEIEFDEAPEIHSDGTHENTNEQSSAKEEEGPEKISEQSDHCGKNHIF